MKKGKKQSLLFQDTKSGRIINFYHDQAMPLNRKSFRYAMKSMKLKHGSKKLGSRIQHEIKVFAQKSKVQSQKKSWKQRRLSRRTKASMPCGIEAPSYAK